MTDPPELTPRRRFKKPEGKAFYLTMRDGVRIAIDLWLPGDLSEDEKIPTLVRATRYGRNYRPGPILDLLLRLGFFLPIPPYIEINSFTRLGYAFVLIDCRGSGASFGSRPIEWSQDEIDDIGEVIDWINSQPWSNDCVGVQGVSYDGNTAELAVATQRKALRAVAPRFSDFDPQKNAAFPGGVFNQKFIRLWNDGNRHLDNDNLPAALGLPGYIAPFLKLIVRGIKPVDEDQEREHLRQAITERDNIDVYETLSKANFRDDALGPAGETISAVSPYAFRKRIEAAGVPMYVTASWLDAATADGALSRYLSFRNPQQLVIGAWSHGGQYNADPFAAPRTPTDPSLPDQYAEMIRFFERHLRDPFEPQTAKSIRYYTLGSGTWRESGSWPPPGFEHHCLYLSSDGRLGSDAPTQDHMGEDHYRVDFSTTTGEHNRWLTQLHSAPVRYPDRTEEDRKLLTYTTLPFDEDVEITGSPYITLHLSSTHADGALHVYLEDVNPGGRVTYITEGILRLIHHRLSQEEPAYVQLGPYHSFKRADARPLVPGEITPVRFSLYATSALIRTGHALRVAIAGHDASTFARYPAEGEPELRILRTPEHPSHIHIPMKGKPHI